ncbi:MAG: hypothetical protein WC693_05845 [Patescibacteria group bacterium]
MANDREKRHAFEFLVHCLIGDVAHAKVLHALIDAGSVSYEELGITPDDMAVFQALSCIADPKERALSALRGCREGKVLANFGVIQYLFRSRQVQLADLQEGDNGILKVGSDLSHFHKAHTAHLTRILPQEDPAQD